MSPVSTLPAPLYLFDRQDASRQSVSAKYVFYVLANAKDKLLEQYPPVHHLRARGDDPEFRARLRQAVMELLSVLRDRAIDMCRVENVYITKIGLTMPVQWTLEFEEVYSALVSEVFGVDKGIIFFFTETEALARYMYKYHAPKMDPRGEYTTMLFIDYGGHNMACLALTSPVSASALTLVDRMAACLPLPAMSMTPQGTASLELARRLVSHCFFFFFSFLGMGRILTTY